MTERTAAVIVALLALVGVVAATPAAGLVAQQGSPANGTGPAFGAAVSSFMQSSAAQAEGEVDNGMWSVAFERSAGPDRPAMVQARADVLERRLARLEAQRAELLNESAGEVTVRERARAARLAAQADALRDALNETEAAATAVGLDLSRLNQLRQQASNLTGPEVASLARNLTAGSGNGLPVGVAGNGPPDDRGNNAAKERDQNQTTTDEGAADGGQGPPDDPPGNGP